MQQCPRCGQNSPDNARYCKNCSAELRKETNRSEITEKQDLPNKDLLQRVSALIPGFGAFFDLRRDSHNRLSCAPTCLLSTVLSMALVVATIFAWPRLFPPKPNLNIEGNLVPGKSVRLLGSNFSAGSSIRITLDGTPVASANYFLSDSDFYVTDTTANLGSIFGRTVRENFSKDAVIVDGNGTFNIPMTIPLSWKPGSHHVIQAQTLEQSGKATIQAQLPITVISSIKPQITMTHISTPSSSPTSQPIPPQIIVSSHILSFMALEGQSDQNMQFVTLHNSGGAGKWDAKWDANWLNVDPTSNVIDANGDVQVRIGVASQRLSANGSPYTGTITFSAGSSTATVTVNLSVQSSQTPVPSTCSLTASTNSLDLGSVTQGQAANQQLTLVNTGEEAVNWSEDSGGASWLTLDTTSNTILPHGQQVITVTADTSQINTYNATLNFKSSCGNPQVVVTLVVTSPPVLPNLQLSSTSLSFNAGCKSPSPQTIIVSNTGGDTLTWTTTVDSPPPPLTPWLTVTGGQSATSSTPVELTFTVDSTHLGNDTYTSTVNIIPSNGPPQKVTVTLIVQCVS